MHYEVSDDHAQLRLRDMCKPHLIYAAEQYDVRAKANAMRREAVDALVSRLMLRLPLDDPLDLLETADEVKAKFEPQRGDIAGFAVQLDRGDPALDPAGPVGFGTLAQKRGVKRRIKLVGVVHPVVGQMGKLALERGLQFEAVVIVTVRMAVLQAVQPEVLEPRRPVIAPGETEAQETV